jgi:ribonuclease HII
MAWVIGIDEAGYGPNLGPFVMTAVACRVPDSLVDANLWQLLRGAVRSSREEDARLLVDDSKVVYSTARGLLGLERGVLATLWGSNGTATTLRHLIDWACPDDRTDLHGERWYTGTHPVPVHVEAADLAEHRARFEQACVGADVGGWLVQSMVVCTPRFNLVLDANGSKGAVLGHALTTLLRAMYERLPRSQGLYCLIDKHGGRNAYAAMIQHALPGGMVVARQEGMACSAYRVLGLGREVELTFQPRADTEHFCVALASMASKYLRELLMLEFNRFWQEQVPGLKPTAGYPGDATRFLEAIRPAAERLGITEAALWRRK